MRQQPPASSGSLQRFRQKSAGRRWLRPLSLFAFSACAASMLFGQTQPGTVGRRPYLGWSTYSEQTIVPSSSVMNEQNILMQSEAMRSSGLGSHGFKYINLDAGWSGNSDEYGRTLWNSTAFPTFLQMIQHIHANGQKIGIYLNPGIGGGVVSANPPILGTQYHVQDIMVMPLTIGNGFGNAYKIDFTKPGAQEYINSVIDLYASWGIDFIKLDAVTPGSYNDNLNINNIPDVQAMSKAIARSGRPIWFTLSWALDEDYISDWEQNSNARRIEGDVECEGDCPNLTEWQRVLLRFYDLIGWESVSGPTLGWNDLDSLEVGNGATDGITNTEQQTAMTLWAMANAPLTLGGDLTNLTVYGKSLLTNDEVLAVDQSGHPAKQVMGGFTPVWVSNLGNGSYYVAIFNLNAFPTQVTVNWNDLGYTGAVGMRDLWSHAELGSSSQSFSDVLPGHGARLLKIQAIGHVAAPPSQIYGAQTATLYGGTQLSVCPTCASGNKLTYLGIGAANYAVFNVNVKTAGVYRMEVDSMTLGTRSFIINVNDGPDITLNLSGGSSNLPFPTTIPVRLNAGTNSIQFGNPTSYPPDMDRIIISGDGREPYPNFSVYEAENAVLGGSASAGFCGNCSGLASVGNLGGSPQSTVTFDTVNAPVAGTYEMEVDYMTQGQRSFFVSVNGGAETELDLNGYSFGTPTSTVVQVQLNAGSNQIEFSNPDNYAPNLDSIAIGPIIRKANQTAAIIGQTSGNK
jgi:alpha-galactosidase